MRRQPILLRIAIASLVIGAYALVRILISTFSTLQHYPSAQFLPVLLSSQSATGGVDIVLVLFVWGTLVFGGIGIALLVAHVVTRAAGAAVVGGAVAASVYACAQPQQGGWQSQQPQQPVQGWQQPAPLQGWQPEPQPQQHPVQPLGSTPPPPDRIQP